MKPKAVDDALSRFASKVTLSDTGCWLWGGWRNHKGYGMFWYDGRDTPAHRWSYEHLVSEFDLSLDIDHLCRVRHCVNPDHLEPVTRQVNLLRGDTFNARNAAKTHCPRGHEYDSKNTYIKKNGGRSCRACRRVGS